MGIEVSNGNLKIGKDTLIYNITPAKECESRKLGMCQIPDKCYAMKAERLYKAVLPYRTRQMEYWDSHTALEIAGDFLFELNRKRKTPIKYVRIGECGDFRNQDDVDKIFGVADILNQIRPDVKFYGFTARKDLDFDIRPENYVLNGSAFMIDNSFTAVPKDELENYEHVCGGNCRECDLCKEAKGLDIYVGIH